MTNRARVCRIVAIEIYCEVISILATFGTNAEVNSAVGRIAAVIKWPFSQMRLRFDHVAFLYTCHKIV